MRFSTATIVAFSMALSSLAAPTPYVDEDGLVLRDEIEETMLQSRAPPPTDWSDVSKNDKHSQTGKLKPKQGETGTHITYKHNQDGNSGPKHTTQYQVWKPNPHAAGSMTDAGRWRGNDNTGKQHGGIDPPIWHPGNAEGGKAYKATDRQNPPSYDWAKSSKDIHNKLPKDLQTKLTGKGERFDPKKTHVPNTLPPPNRSGSKDDSHKPKAQPANQGTAPRKSAAQWSASAQGAKNKIGSGHVVGKKAGSKTV